MNFQNFPLQLKTTFLFIIIYETEVEDSFCFPLFIYRSLINLNSFSSLINSLRVRFGVGEPFSKQFSFWGYREIIFVLRCNSALPARHTSNHCSSSVKNKIKIIVILRLNLFRSTAADLPASWRPPTGLGHNHLLTSRPDNQPSRNSTRIRSHLLLSAANWRHSHYVSNRERETASHHSCPSTPRTRARKRKHSERSTCDWTWSRFPIFSTHFHAAQLYWLMIVYWFLSAVPRGSAARFAKTRHQI